MDGLGLWLFFLVLLILAGGDRSEESTGPTVVVNNGRPGARHSGGAGNVIAFLSTLWLVAYMLTKIA